jgi:hypothetical protein
MKSFGHWSDDLKRPRSRALPFREVLYSSAHTQDGAGPIPHRPIARASSLVRLAREPVIHPPDRVPLLRYKSIDEKLLLCLRNVDDGDHGEGTGQAGLHKDQHPIHDTNLS